MRAKRSAAARDALPDEVFSRIRGALFFGPSFLVTRNKLSFRDNLTQLLQVATSGVTDHLPPAVPVTFVSGPQPANLILVPGIVKLSVPTSSGSLRTGSWLATLNLTRMSGLSAFQTRQLR